MMIRFFIERIVASSLSEMIRSNSRSEANRQRALARAEFNRMKQELSKPDGHIHWPEKLREPKTQTRQLLDDWKKSLREDE